jgi:hypothetical protein
VVRISGFPCALPGYSFHGDDRDQRLTEADGDFRKALIASFNRASFLGR